MATTRDAVREAIRKKKESMERKGGGSDIYDELRYGKNLRRILPASGPEVPKEEKKVFFNEYAVHFKVGPSKKRVRCIGRWTDKGYSEKDTKCPICKIYNQEKDKIFKKYSFKNDEERVKRLLRKIDNAYRLKVRFSMNAFDPSSEDKTVRVLEVGPTVIQPMFELYMDADEICGDFTDTETGQALIIRKDGNPKDVFSTKYSVRHTGRVKPIKWRRYKKQLHDLEAAAGERLKPSQILAILEGSDQEEEDDDLASDEIESKERDESEDDEDDDEEAARAAARRKKKAKKRRSE